MDIYDKINELYDKKERLNLVAAMSELPSSMKRES